MNTLNKTYKNGKKKPMKPEKTHENTEIKNNGNRRKPMKIGKNKTQKERKKTNDNQRKLNKTHKNIKNNENWTSPASRQQRRSKHHRTVTDSGRTSKRDHAKKKQADPVTT